MLCCCALLPDQLQCWQAEILQSFVDSPPMAGATTLLQPTQRAQTHWSRALHAGTAGAPHACPAAHGYPAAAGKDCPRGQMHDSSSRRIAGLLLFESAGVSRSAALLAASKSPHSMRRSHDMRSASRSAHLGIDAVLDKAALALPLHIVVTRELGEAPAHKHVTWHC
jgi:hypothetical protein